jgi:hypothetical protein
MPKILYGDIYEDKRMEIVYILRCTFGTFLCDYTKENSSVHLLLLNKDVTQLT